MFIRDEIEGYRDEVIALRRDFHQHPELGFAEFRTAMVVEAYLQSLGLETTRVAGTGVVAVLEGERAGATLMLRADMDALPVQEENLFDYASKSPGVMHACGHDAHMAMLLVAAKILVNNRSLIAGAIKFVFQPNEEVAGALQMVREGVLENPKVDAAMGIHIWTPVPSGKIGVNVGAVMGGLDVFKLVLNGRGGHTGQPHEAIDPVLAAASVIQNVQMIQTREISNLKSTTIMFGRIEGGTKSNIIPDRVYLEGSIRFLYRGGPESLECPTERFQRIVQDVCHTHRCSCDIDIEHENVPLVNDPYMVEVVRETVDRLFGSVETLVDNISMASEDFSEFSERVPGVFIFLGTGNPEKETDFPHHNPRFNIDEDVLVDGVALHVNGALNYLRRFEKI